MRPMGFCGIAAALLLSAVVTTAASAQDYPSRQIILLQGFAPGGSADTIARLIADPLSKRLGVPVIVEPKPGAGGNIAADAVARAEPDGYTLGLVTGGHAVSRAIYKELPFDPSGDFTMITNVVDYSFVFAVPADSDVTTIAELIDKAKEKPGSVSYGSAGVGTTHHLTGELFASTADVSIVHIPYRGEGGAITAILSGEIPLIIASPVTLAPQIAAGKLRALAVTSDVRWEGLPDVPTMQEAGLDGFNVTTWAGIVGPKDLPADVVERLGRELTAVLADASVSERVEGAVGGTINPSTPDEMRARVDGDIVRWVELVEEVGIERQ